MIKVAFVDETGKQSDKRTFHVLTDCFYTDDRTARAKAKAIGIDLDRYNDTAMASIEVLKP